MLRRKYIIPMLTGGKPNLRRSLVSWWTLDETSAGAAPVTRNDSHGSNHLTDVNNTASAVGKKSNGADLEISSSQYLNVADNASLSTGDIDFTIAAWVNFESAPSANNTGRSFLSKYLLTGNQREWLLTWERVDGSSQNHIIFVVSNNGTATTVQKASTLGLPVISTWYYVIAWHDSVANTINIQVNNGAVDSTSYSSGVFDSTAAFMVGWNVATYYMDGIVDEVGFWKRVLTSKERGWLYNNGSGRAYSEL